MKVIFHKHNTDIKTPFNYYISISDLLFLNVQKINMNRWVDRQTDIVRKILLN